jgi:hypothetical protein
VTSSSASFSAPLPLAHPSERLEDAPAHRLSSLSGLLRHPAEEGRFDGDVLGPTQFARPLIRTVTGLQRERGLSVSEPRV